MKNPVQFILLGALLFFHSCNSGNQPNALDTNANQDSSNQAPEIDEIQINFNPPFGCPVLTKLKYPKDWKGDLENYGHLEKINGDEFENIGQCFAAINRVHTIPSPEYKKIEVLEFGDIFKPSNNFDASKKKSVDSCKYRLPNLGIYECYYSYDHYGNLLLLDPETKNGKILTIYADDIGGDAQTIFRYFYLDKNAIKIYEGSCYDDGCSMDEKFIILIKQNGEIDISPI